jgi:hypothetical protein
MKKHVRFKNELTPFAHSANQDTQKHIIKAHAVLFVCAIAFTHAANKMLKAQVPLKIGGHTQPSAATQRDNEDAALGVV